MRYSVTCAPCLSRGPDARLNLVHERRPADPTSSGGKLRVPGLWGGSDRPLLLVQRVPVRVDGGTRPAGTGDSGEAAMAGVDGLWGSPARSVEGDGVPGLVNGHACVD